MQSITPEVLSGVAGVLISLVLTYIPGLNVRWQALSADYKRLWLLGALGVTAGGIVALSCTGIIPYLTCDQGGLIEFGKIFAVALIANQSVYPLSIGLERVKARAEYSAKQ